MSNTASRILHHSAAVLRPSNYSNPHAQLKEDRSRCRGSPLANIVFQHARDLDTDEQLRNETWSPLTKTDPLRGFEQVTVKLGFGYERPVWFEFLPPVYSNLSGVGSSCTVVNLVF